MLLETLIIVDGRFESNRLAEEESITNLYPWHEIIVAAGMNQLHTTTQIQAILLDIIPALGTDREIILHAIKTRMIIFNLTQQHPIVFYKVSGLSLNTEIEILRTIITQV